MITSSADFGVDCEPDEERSVDPLTLLGRWTRSGGEGAPPLMSLATNGIDGYPRVRHVLLSESDDTAVYFHTDSRSDKAEQIASSPRAACALVWPDEGKQVVMHGDVRPVDPTVAADAYARRTRYLQILAWCNDAEMAHRRQEDRRDAWALFDTQHDQLDPPPTWVGYMLTPREITFWRGDPVGPSRRIRFVRKTGDEWETEVLPG